MHESERLINEAQQAGAHGVVLKSQAARDLIRAIEQLIAGSTFFTKELIEETQDSHAPVQPKKHYRTSALWPGVFAWPSLNRALA
jgi:DNA-binding NarL/FixJ family response regulator